MRIVVQHRHNLLCYILLSSPEMRIATSSSTIYHRQVDPDITFNRQAQPERNHYISGVQKIWPTSLDAKPPIVIQNNVNPSENDSPHRNHKKFPKLQKQVFDANKTKRHNLWTKVKCTH